MVDCFVMKDPDKDVFRSLFVADFDDCREKTQIAKVCLIQSGIN